MNIAQRGKDSYRTKVEKEYYDNLRVGNLRVGNIYQNLGENLVAELSAPSIGPFTDQANGSVLGATDYGIVLTEVSSGIGTTVTLPKLEDVPVGKIYFFKNTAPEGIIHTIFTQDNETIDNTDHTVNGLQTDQQEGFFVISTPNGWATVGLDQSNVIGAEIWPQISKDNSNRSYDPDHLIDSSNIANLAIQNQFEIFKSGDITGRSKGDTWLGSTMDEHVLYTSLSLISDDNNNIVDPSGVVLALDRDTGATKWSVSMETLSGVTGEFSRSAPLIVGDRLYIASARNQPQTWSVQPNDPATATVYQIFSGTPATGTGARPYLYCLDKNTGSLIWKKPIGKVATKLDDLDNYLTVSNSPIKFTAGGTDYIVVTTSSLQSYVGGLYSRVPFTIFGGAPPILDKSFRMTSNGQVFIFEAQSGTLVKRVSGGPPIYSAGQIMNNADTVENGGGYLRPGETYFKIRRYITTDDIASGGPLGTGGVLDTNTGGSNGVDQWIQPGNRLSYSPTPAPAFLANISQNLIPGPLDDLPVRDRLNVPLKLTGTVSILSKTIANPVVLTTRQTHKFTAADVGIFVNVKGDDTIPDNTYSIAAVPNNTTLTLNYDNSGGSSNGGGCVGSPGVAVVNFVDPVVTTATPHGLAVNDTIALYNDSVDRYATVTNVISPTQFEVNPIPSSFSNFTGNIADNVAINDFNLLNNDSTPVQTFANPLFIQAPLRLALVARGGSPGLGVDGRDAVVTPFLRSSAFGVDIQLVGGSLDFTVGAKTYSINSVCTDAATARIYKYISDGDVLDDQDAYEASYHGGTAWGSGPAVVTDGSGEALELYISTGQSHHVPIDEIDAFRNNPGYVAFVNQEKAIFDAQNIYEGSKTQVNLDNLRTAINQRCINNQTDRNVVLSPRGERHFHNAVFAINLRPGSFGDIIWNYKIAPFDNWHFGFSNVLTLSNLVPPSIPIDVNSSQVFKTSFVDPQEYYDMERSPDGDFGEGPYLLNNNGTYYIGGVNKGGLAFSGQLSDPLVGPTSLTILPGYQNTGVTVVGHPSLLGGSNFGSCADANTIYSAQAQSPAYNEFSLSYQTEPSRTYTNGLPLNYPVQLKWYPTNAAGPVVTGLEQSQSYLSAYDVPTQNIKWETVIRPNDPLPVPGGIYANTIGCGAVSSDFVYLQDSRGELHVFNKAGSEVKNIVIPGQDGGLAKPILTGDKVYILNGRIGFADTWNFNGGQNPQQNSNYAGAKFMNVLSA